MRFKGRQSSGRVLRLAECSSAGIVADKLRLLQLSTATRFTGLVSSTRRILAPDEGGVCSKSVASGLDWVTRDLRCCVRSACAVGV